MGKMGDTFERKQANILKTAVSNNEILTEKFLPRHKFYI